MRTFVTGVVALLMCASLAVGQIPAPPKQAAKDGKAEAPATGGVATEEAIRPGDTVATVENTKLMLAEQVVADVPKGTQFQVKAVRGRWVGVLGSVAGKNLDGWLDRSVLNHLGDSTAAASPPRSIPAPPATSPTAAPATPAAGDIREADLSQRIAALERQVAKMQEERKELVDIANDQSKMLRDIAASRTSPEGNKYFVPNVQAIGADPASRHELVDTVVRGMSRTTGSLLIRNDMNSGQSLVINGVQTVYVAPHTQSVVTVPSGTATTELVGAGEGTRSWAIGPPNYQQEVIVAPAANSAVSSVGQWHYDPLTGSYWRTLP